MTPRSGSRLSCSAASISSSGSRGVATSGSGGLLSSYLESQDYLKAAPASWEQAACIYFDLRRCGKSVHSPIDCCIAQLALEHDALLLHRDRDFATIAGIRPLRQLWLE